MHSSSLPPPPCNEGFPVMDDDLSTRGRSPASFGAFAGRLDVPPMTTFPRPQSAAVGVVMTRRAGASVSPPLLASLAHESELQRRSGESSPPPPPPRQIA